MADEVQPGKSWSKVAEIYARVANENDPKSPSGAACREILAAVDEALPFDKANFILDMGCGNGQVISQVLGSSKHAGQIPNGARIVAADVSQKFLDMVKERKAERSSQNPIWNRLEVRCWDARNLHNEVQDGDVSHLIAAFAYFAMAGEQEALAEAFRVLKKGGVFAGTSFGYTEWGHLPHFIKHVRPDKTIPGPGEHWQSIKGVKKTLSDAGFKNVLAKEFEVGLALDTRQEAVDFVMEGFPYVKPLMADMSEEEVTKTKDAMLQFVKERHPGEPLRLTGTALIGWGTK